MNLYKFLLLLASYDQVLSRLAQLEEMTFPPAITFNLRHGKDRLVRLNMLHTLMTSKLNIGLSLSDHVSMIKHINSKSNYLSLMINSFSHELKTPLSKILMLIDMNLQSEFISTVNSDFKTVSNMATHRVSKSSKSINSMIKSPKVANYVNASPKLTEGQTKRIRDISSNLLFFINGVMDFAKVINNRIDIVKKTFNVYDMLAEVTSGFDSTLADKGLEKIIDCDGEAEMLSDRKIVQEILFVLLDNSVKFTAKGGIRLKFESDFEERNYTFKIIDTGCGCSIEDLEAIQFILTDPFGSDNKTRSSAGLGIGLRTAQALIASLSDGQTNLNFTSKKRQGTTVSFKVPFEGQIIAQSAIQRVVGRDMITTPSPVLSKIFWPEAISSESGSSRRQEFDQGFDQERIGLSQILHVDESPKGLEIIKDLDQMILSNLNFISKPKVTLDLKFMQSRMYDYDKTRVKEVSESLESSSSELSKMVLKQGLPEVLVVDDDDFITDMLSYLLNGMGVCTRTAQSAEEALAVCDKLLFAQRKIAMVITDFNMPNMNGAELATMLRAEEYKPILKDTPIIVLTAQDEASTKQECLRAGITEFLAKPIMTKDLKRLLDTYVMSNLDPKDEDVNLTPLAKHGYNILADN